MTLWGGRFGPGNPLWDFTVSHSDHRLLGDDIAGSIAHVTMLGAQGILEEAAVASLLDGLQTIALEAEANEFEYLDTDEDIHSAVERRLGELIGPVAGKLHTGRSRNDQVALDLRLYLRRVVVNHIADVRVLITALVDSAEGVGDVVVASYSHMQQAQAVPLAHHLLAYCWMLRRDAERFTDAVARIDVSPLGAGAGGGSSFPLDPSLVASELGLAAAFDNSMDAVGSRDFAAEYVFCCAQTMVTLSRLAEELVLWSGAEFGWASFADTHTTGSSAMPQKRNPDMAELDRGKAATAIGDLTSLLALQKGLPLTYNRDLQEDKEPVFRSGDALAGSVRAIAEMLEGAEFHPPPPSSWVSALDLAESLASRGVPFREAHEAVSALVSRLVGEGRTFDDLTREDLAAAHNSFEASDVELTDPHVSVARRRSPGGGSLASAEEQKVQLRNWLAG